MEAASGRVVLQLADGAGDGAEDILGEVGGVGVLQALPAQVAVDQGPVQADTPPRRARPAGRAGAPAGSPG